MNKLTGQLLHACFEQGPFEHENLIRACQAWPQLARFWLGSRNRAWGYKEDIWSCRGDPSDDLIVYGTIQTYPPSEFQWVLFVDHNPYLIVHLMEQDQTLFSLFLQGWMEPEPHDFRTLETSMNFFSRDPEAQIEARFYPEEVLNIPAGLYSDFLNKPWLPEQLTWSRLSYILEVYRKITPYKFPLFEALATLVWENRDRLPRKSE